ncbi:MULTISPECIES: glycerol-3-phosphate dehydrogenase [unclassified Agarivorans]|uniref:glycerol-3-phosphate dehydrogenase n=1 Tax=unclassified Agarivorans TaxID=2636026 RepID=UPI0010D62E3C|nr:MULTISPECIES: glycerol-3-phosphate dehydrogenase [unclassified Agarivorans]MDO6685431.1 glycerol-3-phosphate dehydrogenase [Agarivorans sp. 3_MG-2023]MDO6715817.1 glycerol-3-phosphate dehydrogenase [Agarivorans sp. 2_MG-2023]MDO6764859.1 glycerol-3-phosphate dehydrogenase [Agarivorans sp. 1_MG-2023]GDY25239.1 glycerol-3-phosphate dehydrogenase [Agarivorans sp. Toyoura001]
MEQTNDPYSYDLIVIGGGINGVGIAADAAGRGQRVALFEQNDLASATSSASSKLIHGGLRYLEHYEFRLVSEALKEREVLLKMAPHLVEPMRFRLPHRPHLRPWLLIRMGLFLYDNLAKRGTLPACQGLSFGQNSVLKKDITKGFEYSDCWVDDARLVISNALLAEKHGAYIAPRHKVIAAKRDGQHWLVDVQNTHSGKQQQYRCATLVNAAGPWVQQFIEQHMQQTPPRTIRLVKGSHIVVPKIHNEQQSYILQNSDKRIVFVIPYQQEYSLIGTTDVEYKGNPSEVAISDEEVNYLCDVVNQHFKQQIAPSDVLHTFSGVRPLCQDESDDPSAVTRDYTLELSDESDGAPLLSVFGGKLTTYRKLAEAALEMLAPRIKDLGPAWTKASFLPGGAIHSSIQSFIKLQQAESDLPAELIARWCMQYGNRAKQLLHDAQQQGLGELFGGNLYQIEVDYLRNNEWASELDDILWRRTKQGLKFDAEQQQTLQNYLASKLSLTAVENGTVDSVNVD